jgi:catecholate siderophore receptor
MGFNLGFAMMMKTHQRRLRGFLLASAVSLVPAAAVAQDSPADEIIVEGDRTTYTNTRTSTATKTDTALVDIPQSITVVTRDLIDDQALRTLADVARFVPGVGFGQGEGHRDAPVFRGNQSTADFFIDGVRDDAEYFRDLYNLERLEVIKGPNALIFGRGAGGGLINRVTRKAEFETNRELELKGGQFGYGRGAVDLGGAVSDTIALRLNAFYENSDSYRDFVGTELFGVNPTGAVKLGERTTVRLSYEYFSDERAVDRGVPSVDDIDPLASPEFPFRGDRSAFFGNPDESFSEFERNAVVATLEHAFSDSFTLRNNLSYASNDKFYSNVFASGRVNNVTGAVPLQSYFSSQQRRNLFNQTDLVWKVSTGDINHTILFGAEAGLQDTENFRTPNNNVPVGVNIAAPTTFAPSPFLGVQNDNLVDLNVIGVYLQDQIDVTSWLKLIGGVRYDRFDLEFDTSVAGQVDAARVDGVFSPRGGVIVKPVENASLYFSYSRSFLPQSGDQFANLSPISFAALEPEIFENLEFGAKWNISARLELAASVYQLDRTNTRAIDPVTLLTALTGEQRSKGVEVTLAGSITDKWELIAGYAYQDAEITRGSTLGALGRNAPLVPQQSVSMWSSYEVLPGLRLGAGLIHQSDRFTTFSNQVVLPDFTRIDAAVFYRVSDAIDVQVNVENLGNTLYFPTAHNDNNITPGAPRNVRASLRARF